MNMFERASRTKLRFQSTVGDLTTEQLWDLPLVAKGERPDLDRVSRAVYAALKGVTEESFVEVKPNPRKTELELALDIVKHVIASKQADIAAAEKAAATAERKRKLLNALAAKDDADLAGMTRDQIEAEIAKLGA